MKLESAIKKANKLGYTIRYHETESELRYRKLGGVVDALNQPHLYCSIYATNKKNDWQIEEKVSPIVI